MITVHRFKLELLLLSITILIALTLSVANVRKFVDILFVEGMSATIVGSLLIALALRPSMTMTSKNETTENRKSHCVLGRKILIVGIILVLSSVLIGEFWARKQTVP